MKLSTRPSPAIVVAVCALVFAVAGSAIAGTDGLNSKITKSKVKKIAKKQANKQLKANVSGSHVNRADRADTADTATNATNATNAQNATTAGSVDGVNLVRFNYHSDATAVVTTVLNEGGLILNASCTGGSLDFTADTTTANSYLASASFDATAGGTTNEVETEPFNPGANTNLIPAFDNGVVSHTAYYNQDSNVQVQWTADNNIGGANDFDCDVVGTATVG